MGKQLRNTATAGARRRLRTAMLLLGLLPGIARAEPAPTLVTLPPRAALPYTLQTCQILRGDELLVLDLDGDGAPELVTYGTDPDTLSRDFVLASRLDGRVTRPLKQWNFVADRGGLAGTADLDPSDGREELLLWSCADGGLHFRADGLRSGPAGVEVRTLWRSEAVPLPKAAAGAPIPRLHRSGRLDVAADLCVTLPIAGFELVPRGPLLFGADGRLRRHAAAAPNVLITALADLDGDGRPELFLGTHATCNGQVLPGEDDCHSYWRVLDARGNRLLDVEAAGSFSEAHTYPLRTAGQAPRVAAVLFGVDGRCPVRVYAADGALLRERSLPAALWRSLVIDWDRDGSDELLLGLTDGRLLLLDRELALLADWRFAAAVGPLAAVDLRERGRPDLLLAVGNQLALCDQSLRPLALWDGELLYSHQLPQRASGWISAEGLSFVGLSRGLPAASVLLELVSAAPSLAGRGLWDWLLPLLALAAGIAIGIGLWAAWPRRQAAAAAPATAEHWRALRDQLRGFRHSAAARGQLESLIFALRNSQGEAAARYYPRLRDEAAAFQAQTLPILQQIASLAAAGPWEAPHGRAFAAESERLAHFAADLASQPPPPASTLAAAERAARAIRAEVDALRHEVDARLALSPAQFLGLLLTRFAAAGLPLLLELRGDWQDEAPIANPDEADQLFGRVAQLFAERRDRARASLTLRAQRDPTHLLVGCRDDAAGAPPGPADLERLGISALAARLHCGLRCHEGEVLLAFTLAAPRKRTRRAAAVDS